jgi:hypothetical protein
VYTRETGRGWPLLTVETAVNGDSKSTNERGPSVVGSLRLSGRYKRFLFSLLAALVGPKQNLLFLTVHFFNSFVPITQQAGQTATLGCMSLSMCLWCILYTYSCLKKPPMWYRKSIKHCLTINHSQKRYKHVSPHLRDKLKKN